MIWFFVAVVFNLFMFNVLDMVRARARGMSWRQARRFAVTHLPWLIANLINGCVITVVIIVLDNLTTHIVDWYYVGGVLVATGVQVVLIIIWWWNQRGRKKLAQLLAGFKHRARLLKMGVAINPA